MPLLTIYYPDLRVFYTMIYVLFLLLVGLCLSLSCLFVELEEREIIPMLPCLFRI